MPRKQIETAGETATKETTIVTRMKEEVPIALVKAENQVENQVENQPETAPETGGPVVFNQIESLEPETEELPDERDEIEALLDLFAGQNLTACIYRLPNFALDYRTDSRAIRERVGKLPLSLFLEDAIQLQFGAGTYLVEIRDERNRFRTRLSSPIIIAATDKGKNAPDALQPTFIQPPINPFDEKYLLMQDKMFAAVFKLIDKTAKDEPKTSEFDLFEKFVNLQKSLQPESEGKDDFMQLAKTMLIEQIKNPAEPVVIDSGDGGGWARVFAPAVSALAEAIPTGFAALMQYVTVSAKQTENAAKLEAERIKAELIKQGQQLELERLRLAQLQLQNNFVPPETAPETAPESSEIPVNPRPRQATAVTVTNQNKENEMNNLLDELLTALRENQPTDEIAEQFAAALNQNPHLKYILAPFIEAPAEDLLEQLQTASKEDLSGIPHAATWIAALQMGLKGRW